MTMANVNFFRGWLAVLFCILQLPAVADGATVEECLGAHEESQVRKNGSDFIGARETLLICSSESCPQVVRKECLGWFSELKELVPSVTIIAQVDDRDVFDAQVFIDEELQSTELGSSIELNPGRYKIRVEVPGLEPETRQLVLLQGQKSRVLEFRFEAPSASKEVPTSDRATTESRPAPIEMHRPIPMVTYALAGAAPLVAAIGIPFAVSGQKRLNEYSAGGSEACAPYCSQDQKKEVDRQFRNADIFFIAGGVVGVAALVTYIVRPEIPVQDPASDTALSWNLRAGRTGGALTLNGKF